MSSQSGIPCHVYPQKISGNILNTLSFHTFVSIILASGMILEWKQNSGLLFASGDVRVIKVWDVQQELKVQVSSSSVLSAVNCICS